MERYYNKAVIGTDVKSLAMIFKTDAPLDDRTAVRSKAALLSKTALGDSDGGKKWLFNGLITCDRQTGDIYTLFDKDELELKTDSELDQMTDDAIDAAVAAAWKKMATSDTVQSQMAALSGVHKFKGVAKSIDPDFTTITLAPLQITETEGGAAVSYSCTGYNYDLIHKKYFKWENGASVHYTKDGENPIKLYTRSGSETTALYVMYNGVPYFPASSTIPVTQFTSLDGDSIYTSGVSAAASNVAFYSSSTTQNNDTKVGDLDVLSYSAYSFTEISESYHNIEIQGNGNPVVAAESNAGDVYQIGDKEYASNGTIWVELGSPTNEWIIL